MDQKGSGMDELAALAGDISGLSAMRIWGRIYAILGGTVEIKGLSDHAAIGDRVLIVTGSGRRIGAEVVALRDRITTVLPEGSADGVAVGNRARLIGALEIAPHDSWIGRILDPSARPLDGQPLRRGGMARPLRASPPPAATRQRLGARLDTGLAVFNTLLPLVRGQRIGLFAGSGVGKSSLLAQMARGLTADLVVIALVGERGRELREFVETVLGPEGMRRAIVVVATSDQPALVRRRCALTAITIAEHFRDRGLHVLFLADSVTRFAEAHREIAVAGGEAPSLRGYPPSTSGAIMTLAERTGPGPEGAGDITAVFTVLVAGSDMDEPVADILRGTLDGHVVMDRAIAERGRFPAIDVLRSVSRSLPGAASDAENALIAQARRLLGVYAGAEMMVRAGLYTPGADPVVDRAIAVWPALDAFVGETGDVAASFARLAECLGEPG
ncbi:FliI/YscN family ATPase [Paracoccus sp. p4-l81]